MGKRAKRSASSVARETAEYTGPMEISATEFKAKCLQLMDRVKQSRETIVITKHGKPVARLMPPDEPIASLWASMAGSGEILGDIVGPLMPDYEPPDFPPGFDWGGNDPEG